MVMPERFEKPQNEFVKSFKLKTQDNPTEATKTSIELVRRRA